MGTRDSEGATRSPLLLRTLYGRSCQYAGRMVLPEHPYTNKDVFVRLLCFRTRAIVVRQGRVLMGSEHRLLVRLDDGEVRSVRARDVVEKPLM